jgi:hypothetical protein
MIGEQGTCLVKPSPPKGRFVTSLSRSPQVTKDWIKPVLMGLKSPTCAGHSRWKGGHVNQRNPSEIDLEQIGLTSAVPVRHQFCSAECRRSREATVGR